tara:strand:- start:761 stop:3208 length:2448 start_codon:yes stop_codon:yes gene_type:complete
MAWYDTGTVNVTNGSTAVTGVGTNFIAGAQVGEGFYSSDDSLYEIQSIVSATSLTLADPYLGATQTGQTYKIIPTQSLVASLATQVSTLIADFQGVADEAGEGKFNTGTAASPGVTFTLDQDTGIFRPAANQLGFTTAGVQRALLTSTGLNSTVIGATTPAAVTGTAITGTSFASTGNMTFGDSDKALFGAGGDLQIFHDGGNSIIDEVGTGDLFIRGTNINLQNRDATPNETFISCVANGAVTISHNNLAKFATTAGGVAVTGDMTFGDNDKAIFGSGGDLRVWHNGANSYIQDLGTGGLVLTSDGSAVLINVPADQNLANFNQNGSVYLRHSAAGVSTDRLTTTSGGVSVNGDIGLTGTIDGRNLATDGAKLDAINQPLATTSTPNFNALNISKTTAGFGNLEIGGSLGAVIDLKAPFSDDYDARIQYNSGVDLSLATVANEPIRLNHQGVTRLATSNTGVNLIGNVSVPSGSLAVQSADLGTTAGNTSETLSLRTDTTNVDRMLFTTRRTSAGTNWITAAHRMQRHVDTSIMGYMQFGNNNTDLITFGENTSEYMRIDGEGNVGIGNSTPTQKLEVGGNVAVTGEYVGTGAVVAGQGSGSVAMTVNDGYGNANLTFNHAKGIPDVLGNGARIVVNVDVTSSPNMSFQLGTATAVGAAYSPTERMRLTETGLVVPDGVYLGGEAPANLLDDYEEGTWNPILTGTTTNPTYTNSSTYTKVGRLVTVNTSITFSTAGSGNYSITTASLPFVRADNFITGTVSVLDSGTAWYVGVTRSDSSNFVLYINTHQQFTSTTPFTVSNGDKLNVTITYFTT